MRVLVNDGMHATGKAKLEAAGWEVVTDRIEQDHLPSELPAYDAIIVRSATKVRQALIDQCPNLKVILRGGVGMDNIDVEYARSKGLGVYNTPSASSLSVAELAFAHIFNIARSVYMANRSMPTEGNTAFKSLKKSYSKGTELRGKTLGLIGFGRIGQETAKVALGLGMKVVAVDPYIPSAELKLEIFDGQSISTTINSIPMDEMLAQADFISLHIPFTGAPVLSHDEFAKMKDGVVVINAARGGTIDEDALLAALESGKVAGAGLDVFVNEPTPREDLLKHPKVSLSPHIGASTQEAQEKIGLELADQLIAHFA
ncbi:MAG: D-2-hydroxyacid dehydrogenase [Bacteroidota bacterium]